VTTAALPGTEALPSAVPAEPRAWVQFLLVGGLTLVFLPLALVAVRLFGLDDAELAVGFTTFYGAYVINDPHFTVTYLLFYENARERAFGRAFEPWQRARYVVAGVVAPLVLVAWAALSIATGSARSLGFMIDLMFALVGWHYTKQGFGVLTVLSGRRGVRFAPNERRVLLAHAFAGWAYAWASPATGASAMEEKGVVYLALPHPRAFELAAGAAFALSSVALLAMLVVKVRRERRLPPAAPLVGFLASIWAWSVFSSIDPLMIYVIPALHSIQYLYFVWLLKRNEALEAEAAPHFGRPTQQKLLVLGLSAVGLGVLVFHAGPTLLDAAHLLVPARAREALHPLGPTPWFSAVFAIVNIHHYLMDTVLWRRENPPTRYLYR
jgi:hypothetical protein